MEKVEPQPIIREERPSWERNARFDRGGGGGGYDRAGDRGDRGGDRGADRGDREPREASRTPRPTAEPAAKD
jgi:hypothetical protein